MIQVSEEEIKEMQYNDFGSISVEDMSILQKAHMITEDGTIIPLEQ